MISSGIQIFDETETSPSSLSSFSSSSSNITTSSKFLTTGHHGRSCLNMTTSFILRQGISTAQQLASTVRRKRRRAMYHLPSTHSLSINATSCNNQKHTSATLPAQQPKPPKSQPILSQYAIIPHHQFFVPAAVPKSKMIGMVRKPTDGSSPHPHHHSHPHQIPSPHHLPHPPHIPPHHLPPPPPPPPPHHHIPPHLNPHPLQPHQHRGWAGSRDLNGSVHNDSRSHLYVRPYTPTADYTPSVDYSSAPPSDAVSRDLAMGSISEFSVTDFNNRPIDADTISQSTVKGSQSGQSATNTNRESSPSSEDSGVQEDIDGGQNQSRSNKPPRPKKLLNKEQIGRQSADICRELGTDVTEEQEKPQELLEELDEKIRPFLITLDEELNSQEKLVRQNLDSCRISELRVNWLLEYNKFTITFREILTSLCKDIFDELEYILRLRHRGCIGLKINTEKKTKLEGMSKTLHYLHDAIAEERSRPEAAYA